MDSSPWPGAAILTCFQSWEEPGEAGLLHESPGTAVTRYYTLSGLKQLRFILLWFSWSHV